MPAIFPLRFSKHTAQQITFLQLARLGQPKTRNLLYFYLPHSTILRRKDCASKASFSATTPTLLLALKFTASLIY